MFPLQAIVSHGELPSGRTQAAQVKSVFTDGIEFNVRYVFPSNWSDEQGFPKRSSAYVIVPKD